MTQAFLAGVLDPFAVMNAIGLIAFALVGSTKAIRREFDLFGVAVVGLATAFAGGVTRDILVGRIPLALQLPGEIALGTIGVLLAIGLHLVLDSADDHPVALVADGVGLGAFTTAGAIVAVDVGVSGFGVVAIATINAVGGGAVADILLNRSPFILFEDFYASCSVLGAIVYLGATIVGLTAGTAAAACAGTTVLVRLIAVAYGWTLPTAQSIQRVN
ncbi:trimeric intracellular cation channel family protein [Natronorubrum daqingense]|uniref:Uncharacterized membrane protein YeiH n=1 Tax=Natronorubrum daqingense TaxID=588898 RepID=A0A1N7A533_9EURY|nr:TRIC cation channel family protein [Natronorubrum daqingense]APX95140.1 hypothetical protein BB347_00180 [Natronorubrum daqingense]SIR34139.1 Uncharacterized membrane protein YeiH [Natronorubrum daqingense]